MKVFNTYLIKRNVATSESSALFLLITALLNQGFTSEMKNMKNCRLPWILS